MDMDVGADLILSWDRDWISSHDLQHLYADGQVRSRSGPALLQLYLLPAGARPASRTLQVIGHGGFRRLLRQLAHDEQSPGAAADSPPAPHTPERAADGPLLDGVVTIASRGPRGARRRRGSNSAGGPRPAPPGPAAGATLRRPLR